MSYSTREPSKGSIVIGIEITTCDGVDCYNVRRYIGRSCQHLMKSTDL
jgi:hypothetical protein